MTRRHRHIGLRNTIFCIICIKKCFFPRGEKRLCFCQPTLLPRRHMQINNRKFKQRRVLATHVNRKWTFAFLGSGLAQMYLANRLCPVRTTLNFVFFFFCKKICQQAAISRANDFSHLPENFLKCHQTSKMWSSRFGGLQFFVRQKNSLFLHSYTSLCHLSSRT